MKRQFCPFLQSTFGSVFVTAALLSITPQTLLAQHRLRPTDFTPLSPEKEHDSRITISTELVSLTVSVVDKQGRYVAGIDRKAFAIYEDGVQQEISFFSDLDAPASVGVVLDLSGSMRGEKIIRAKEAIARFIQTSHPEDEYSLIGFNNFPQLLLDRMRDGGELLSRFSDVSPSGSTALYDALEVSIEALTHSRYAKRALIVISDGEDNKLRAILNQVQRKSQESGVTIYTILIGPLLPRSNGGAVMDQLASASGGESFFPSNAEVMSENFERIALELRHQYSIGYAPTNLTGNGQWRRLKVVITPSAELPHLTVRSRKRYYAVANPTGHWATTDSQIEVLKAVSWASKKQPVTTLLST